MIGEINQLGVIRRNNKSVPPQIPVITVETSSTKASFQIGTYSSPITIDWGDGKQEQMQTTTIAHTYDNRQPRTIRLYTESDSIKSFSVGNVCKASHVDISLSPGITTLYLSGNLITRQSVSNNLKLAWFEIDNNPIVLDDVELRALAETLFDRSKGSAATITLRNVAQAEKIKDVLTARNWVAR